MVESAITSSINQTVKSVDAYKTERKNSDDPEVIDECEFLIAWGNRSIKLQRDALEAFRNATSDGVEEVIDE